MKTPEYYLDEVAKEVNYDSFADMIEKRAQYGSVEVTVKLISASVKKATLRHSKEACEVQKETFIGIVETSTPNELSSGMLKGYLINAKSPIE